MLFWSTHSRDIRMVPLLLILLLKRGSGQGIDVQLLYNWFVPHTLAMRVHKVLGVAILKHWCKRYGR